MSQKGVVYLKHQIHIDHACPCDCLTPSSQCLDAHLSFCFGLPTILFAPMLSSITYPNRSNLSLLFIELLILLLNVVSIRMSKQLRLGISFSLKASSSNLYIERMKFKMHDPSYMVEDLIIDFLASWESVR